MHVLRYNSARPWSYALGGICPKITLISNCCYFIICPTLVECTMWCMAKITFRLFCSRSVKFMQHFPPNNLLRIKSDRLTATKHLLVHLVLGHLHVRLLREAPSVVQYVFGALHQLLGPALNLLLCFFYLKLVREPVSNPRIHIQMYRCPPNNKHCVDTDGMDV